MGSGGWDPYGVHQPNYFAWFVFYIGNGHFWTGGLKNFFLTSSPKTENRDTNSAIKWLKIHLWFISLSKDFCRHKNDISIFFSPVWCYLHVFFWNVMAMTRDIIKSTLCVSVTLFFSVEVHLWSFQIVKSQSLIANIEVYWIRQVK